MLTPFVRLVLSIDVQQPARRAAWHLSIHALRIATFTCCFHRCDALSSCTHCCSITSTAAKPRRRKHDAARYTCSAAAAAAALVAKPRASRALGVRDGLLDRCPETASCISSQDDAARGGRSFRPPWAYDDNDWTGARDKLLVALQRSEASDALVDGRYIRCGDLEFFSRKTTPRFNSEATAATPIGDSPS